MSELPDEPLPQRRAPRNGRRPRFVLPADDHDERVGEVIEAFLDGPPERAERPKRTRSLPGGDRVPALRAPMPLDTRNDWETALRIEDARLARYGHPASVLVIRMRVPDPGTEDRFAARIGRIVRDLARESDRVTRAGPDRFHVLLPETAEPEAVLVGERLRDACASVKGQRPGTGLEIRVAAVSPRSGQNLYDALQFAAEGVAD